MKFLKLFEDYNKNIEFQERISKLNIVDGKVKLYHYSQHKIETEFITPKGIQNLHSRSEFKAWGQSRSFFYTSESGVVFDKGVSSDYKYVCFIPLNEIYMIDINPLNYLGTLSEKYLLSKKDGYTAWMYHLSGDETYPLIVVSFEPVKILNSYKLTNKGYILLNEKLDDFIIGELENYYVVQNKENIDNLLNCYLKNIDDENDINKLENYQWRYIKLYPEFKDSIFKNQIDKAIEDYENL